MKSIKEKLSLSSVLEFVINKPLTKISNEYEIYYKTGYANFILITTLEELDKLIEIGKYNKEDNIHLYNFIKNDSVLLLRPNEYAGISYFHIPYKEDSTYFNNFLKKTFIT